MSGELDLATAPVLCAAVALACHPAPSGELHGRAGGFRLDLRHVTFLDVIGLHALEDIHARVALHMSGLRVTAPAAACPRRFLRFAVDRGWLAPAFAPDAPSRAHSIAVATIKRSKGTGGLRMRHRLTAQQGHTGAPRPSAAGHDGEAR